MRTLFVTAYWKLEEKRRERIGKKEKEDKSEEEEEEEEGRERGVDKALSLSLPSLFSYSFL